MDNYQYRCMLRRTLSKRIRKTISLCILISIMLFGCITGTYMMKMMKTEFSAIANYFGNRIAQVINSGEFLQEMNVNRIEDLDVNSPQVHQWLQKLWELENRSLDFFIGNDHFADDPMVFLQTVEDGSIQKLETSLSQYFRLRDLLKTTIQFGDEIIYPFPTEAKEDERILWSMPEELPPPMKKLRIYFDIHYQYNIYNSKKEIAGSVNVVVNPAITVPVFMFGALVLLLVGLVSLLITNIISKPLANRIIKPIQQMEKTFRQAAEGDYSGCNEKPIQIRRPLCEIESMVQSTNIIIAKLNKYNEEQEQQKMLLQQQNIELEAQNQELADSKLQIEQAQSQLIQMENMAQVGQLTAAISHEINTPLGVISSNVQLSAMLTEALEQLTAGTENDEVRELVVQIAEAGKTSAAACRRIDEIIKNLKVFSKIDQSDFQEADINAGVRSTVVLTTNLWKKNIRITEEYGDLPPVKCYAGLLNQVFMNIMVNAIESIEKQGEIHIKTWHEENQVHISIQDTGKGIPPENLERIFDFGFTTKGDKGMGIGLSMCRDIIRKHGGQILVSAEPGKGSTFTVSLPVSPN